MGILYTFTHHLFGAEPIMAYQVDISEKWDHQEKILQSFFIGNPFLS